MAFIFRLDWKVLCMLGPRRTSPGDEQSSGLPHWPCLLIPHEYSSPDELRARLWPPPAATAEICFSSRERISLGVGD